MAHTFWKESSFVRCYRIGPANRSGSPTVLWVTGRLLIALSVSVRATASMHRPLSVLKWKHGGIS